MLPDALARSPAALGAVVALVTLLVAWQRTLSWSEYRTGHAAKRALFPLIDRLTSLFVISRKGWRQDPEYMGSTDGRVRALWQRLVDSGASPHLLASLKRRPLPDGTQQYAAAHVVWIHADDSQTEVYLFRAPEGGTDVYAHHEPDVMNPRAHLTGPQRNGDPRGMLASALGGSALTDRHAATQRTVSTGE